ncbi:MAG: glycosyltransferase family 4 protein [Planctomycetota bacterium]
MSEVRTQPSVEHGVLLVSQQFAEPRTGVGTFTRVLVDGLLDRGFPVTLASWESEWPAAGHGDLRFWSLGERPKRDRSQAAFRTFGHRVAKRLAGVTETFAAMHFVDAREGHAVVGRPALTRVAGRCIGSVHGEYALHGPSGPFQPRSAIADPRRSWWAHVGMHRLETRTLRRFDGILANSEATRAAVIDGYGLDPERCTVAPVTVAPRTASPAQLDGSPRLLFVGGNFRRKGLEAVLEALPRLRRAFPNLALHVVGRDAEQPWFQQKAQSLRVAETIVWHGRVDPEDCASIFAAADALVVPAHSEGLGLVHLEAFAADVPVIAGLDGGVGEIVQDGVSGLQTMTDGAEIARAVHAVLTDPALAHRLAEGGRAVLASRTVDRFVDGVLGAYGFETAAHEVRAPQDLTPAVG